jgi:hypothetical protein
LQPRERVSAGSQDIIVEIVNETRREEYSMLMGILLIVVIVKLIH